MVSLFASSSSTTKAGKKRPRPTTTATEKDGAFVVSKTPAAPALSPDPCTDATDAAVSPSAEVEEVALGASVAFLSSSSWTQLGLAAWIQRACTTMGFKRPTPVQEKCIPSVLQGRDVMGCAETGSGKTAAFALPMLHRLSEDPYGIFGLVLTPTRELAIQISEQFQALGAPLNLRHTVVIGGVSMVHQSVELARRPHIVVATPGRLWDHLRGAVPPDLSKCRFLVLDEADRLFCDGFEKHLAAILAAMTHPRRQTLLFSATMTHSLENLKSLTRVQPVLFDLTKERTLPSSLQQQYLFMPAQVKMCYLVCLLRKVLLPNKSATSSSTSSDVKSVIIFVGTCQRCQEVTEVMIEAGLAAVSLHSVLSQKRRLASLGKFKSSLVKVLVSTDVASRGLDIPEVDLVVNFDLPRVPSDYVHRVGRTARAGRRGRAVAMVTQYDVALLQRIEVLVGRKMEKCEDVREEEVVKLLNPVAKATRAAKMRLMEVGFDFEVEEHLRRKKRDRKERYQRKRNRVAREGGGES
ncbi:atp-dependent rna helicase ddx49-like [Nannochloropsis oceanica]